MVASSSVAGYGDGGCHGQAGNRRRKSDGDLHRQLVADERIDILVRKYRGRLFRGFFGPQQQHEALPALRTRKEKAPWSAAIQATHGA